MFSRQTSMPKQTPRDIFEDSIQRNKNIHTFFASSNNDVAETVVVSEEKNDQIITSNEPQVLASGFSQNMDMVEALREAVQMAMASLPPPTQNSEINLAVVSVSSLYDGNASPSLVSESRGVGLPDLEVHFPIDSRNIAVQMKVE